MMLLRILLLLVLAESAFCFHSQMPSSGRRRSHNKLKQLQYVDSEKESYLFKSTSIGHGNQNGASHSSSASSSRLNNRHSASDWLYNLRSLPESSVLKNIRNPVMTMTLWATFLSVVHKTFLWTGRNKWAAAMSVSPAAHSFLVSSLGLLLVFRTNSAYQRFQEGRKIWEEIHSLARNLSRLTSLYRNEVGNDRLRRIQHLLAAFPYLLRHHVRSGCLCSPKNVDDRYKVLLKEPTQAVVDSRYEGDKASGGAYRVGQAEAAEVPCYVDRREMPWNLLDEGDALWNVARASNRPLWVCDRLGQELMKIPYTDNYTSRERLTMLGNVDKLTNAIGQCERIHQTAVPLNYARHALRSLSLWCITLPFCMVKDLGFLTGPVTGVIAWLLFGVYQIGHSIEDPFQGSLRLSMLCENIRRDILGNDGEDVTAFSGPRQSAFELESDDDDDEERDYDFFPQLTGKAELASQTIIPHLTESNAPKLILENGKWTVASTTR